MLAQLRDGVLPFLELALHISDLAQQLLDHLFFNDATHLC
jgi:hypothetical protein